MPTNSMKYIKPTTLGRDSGGDKSVAKANPAVWVVCIPAPTNRKATPAAKWPTQSGAWADCPKRPKTSKAKGMMAKPPNCSKVPIQIYGTRRQPKAERWWSERKPIRARKGANNKGKAIMMATKAAGTLSSTIMTRLRVPISMAKAMPTEI